MKFRFCGNRDAPEWILAEVATLSKISCVRLKLLCRQVVIELLGGEIDFDKVQRLVAKVELSDSDIRAVLAALTYVLYSATRYAVKHDVLNQELQQLGLPKENCDGVSRPFRLNCDKLVSHFRSETLKLPRLQNLEWRVAVAVGSDRQHELWAPTVQLKLELSHDLERAQPRIRRHINAASADKQAASTAAADANDIDVHTLPPSARLTHRMAASQRTENADSVIESIKMTGDQFTVLHAELAAAAQHMKNAAQAAQFIKRH